MILFQIDSSSGAISEKTLPSSSDSWMTVFPAANEASSALLRSITLTFSFIDWSNFSESGNENAIIFDVFADDSSEVFITLFQ